MVPTDTVQSSSRSSETIGWSRSELRSTLHYRFRAQDGPTHPGPRGLHPQRANFTPNAALTFQRFGALEILPCQSEGTLTRNEIRRIESVWPQSL